MAAMLIHKLGAKGHVRYNQMFVIVVFIIVIHGCNADT